MKTKHIIMAGAAILVVLGILAGVLLADQFKSDPSYSTRLTNAQRYFDAGDYDKAIVEYMQAIERDDASEDAYLGLAALYYQRSMPELARQTLQNGLLRFGQSERLVRQMELYFPNENQQGVASANQPSVDPLVEKPVSSANPIVNVELLQYMSGASFGDYQNRYGSVQTTMENGKCIATAPGLSAKAYFYDTSTARVINTATGKPYSEFIPNELQLDDIAVLFGGANSIQYSTLLSLPGISSLERGNGIVRFEACGCRIEITCDEQGNISPDAVAIVYPMGRVTQSTRRLYGNVVDASTGSPVMNAVVKIYPGVGTYATPYRAETDSSGYYQIDASESGNFTVVISKEGYIEENFQLYVPDASAEMKNDFTISQELGEGEIRIVLTWGATPSDLDSYLTGTSSDGTAVRVWFSNSSVSNGSGVIADLDVDDMNGYGPETVTIHDVNGVYEFSVVDYTMSTGVGNSGAMVKIYRGNELIETLSPPADVGFGWRVCRIDHGEVTILNGTCNVSEGLLAN